MRFATSRSTAVTALAVTAVLLFWLALRHRAWPGPSAADLGGAALLALTLFAIRTARTHWPATDSTHAKPSPFELVLRWLPLATTVALLGHVSTLAALLLLTIASIAVALSWESVAHRYQQQVLPHFIALYHTCLNALAPAHDSHASTPRNPPATPSESPATKHEETPAHMQSGTAKLLPSRHSDTNLNTNANTHPESQLEPSEESLDENSEQDLEASEASDSLRPTQSWQRFTDSLGCESIQGEALVHFAPGQLLQWLHLPCWPPLPSPPQIELQPWEDDAQAKAAQLERHGVRIEVRLAAPAASPRDVRISFEMIAAPPSR